LSSRVYNVILFHTVVIDYHFLILRSRHARRYHTLLNPRPRVDCDTALLGRSFLLLRLLLLLFALISHHIILYTYTCCFIMCMCCIRGDNIIILYTLRAHSSVIEISWILYYIRVGGYECSSVKGIVCFSWPILYYYYILGYVLS